MTEQYLIEMTAPALTEREMQRIHDGEPTIARHCEKKYLTKIEPETGGRLPTHWFGNLSRAMSFSTREAAELELQRYHEVGYVGDRDSVRVVAKSRI